MGGEMKISRPFLTVELWENIKWSNIHIIGVMEGEGRAWIEAEKYENISGKNFPRKYEVHHAIR